MSCCLFIHTNVIQATQTPTTAIRRDGRASARLTFPSKENPEVEDEDATLLVIGSSFPFVETSAVAVGVLEEVDLVTRGVSKSGYKRVSTIIRRSERENYQ
jgi:hypothetical protein